MFSVPEVSKSGTRCRHQFFFFNSADRNDTLNDNIEKYIDLSIASTTQQTYSSGKKRFVNFVHLYKQKQVDACLPASEALMTEFVAFLAKSIRYPSIKTYLAAVRHFHTCRGLELNLNKMLRLQLVLRGIKRSQGQQLRVCLPITINHLKLFRMLLAVPFTQSFDSKMIWAAITLAFFSFLRLAELATRILIRIYTLLKTVNFSHNTFGQTPESMTIRIKESKTDSFRQGHTITVGAYTCRNLPS